MIDKINIASRNWAEDYMTQNGRRFNNMLRDSFITGFKKGVELSRKRGKWIVSHIPDSMLWECNQCGFDCGAHSFNFCPNCGADMRQDRED